MNKAWIPSLLSILLCCSCAARPDLRAEAPLLPRTSLEPVAEFIDQQPTGLAISRDGRIFVSFPRWGLPVKASVVEVGRGGRVTPFPNKRWNRWSSDKDDPARHFICAQSVVADGSGSLWVLDPASPGFRGVVANGAKLVQIDLDSNQVVRIFAFDARLAPKTSYLNDLRVDTDRQLAFITDSGLGAMLIVDLKTGHARRILDRDPAMHYEPDVRPVIGGRAWQRPDGSVPKVHVDGIALDAKRGVVYVHPLTGKHLFRIPIVALANPELSDKELSTHITDLGPDVVCDGMEVGPEGELYLTALEHDAIAIRKPDGSAPRLLIQDARLRWPDSLAWGPDGNLYVTTSQIHLGPDFRDAQGQPYPFGLWRIRLRTSTNPD